MFALVDCNSFYASCEQVFNPRLIGKPVVVLSNNDGCVIARSKEAKEAGVPMGAPAFKHADDFARNGVIVMSANFALYGDMSRRVMGILEEYAPASEIYSIDEIFLRFDGPADFRAIGLDMCHKVRKWTGIPIGVGFGPTKSLAKAANRIAKKYPARTAGVHVIDSDDLRVKALKWLKVEDIWRIGRRQAAKLEAVGVKDALAFTKMDPAWVKKNLTIVGARLQADLSGDSVLGLDAPAPKKTIATTRSFDTNLSDLDDLRERIGSYAVSCAEKLRKQGSLCASLSVFVRTNPHRQDLPQYSRSVFVRLPFPTNSDIDLVRYAIRALEMIYRSGLHYKKAGVIVHDLTFEDKQIPSLFGGCDPRNAPLMEAVDNINSRYGTRSIRLAALSAKPWRMRQEKLSPRYTTRLSDIIIVRS